MYPISIRAAASPICPTPQIDALLAVVWETEKCLGQGTPAVGAEYEVLASGLRGIAEELRTVSRVKSWEGAAGRMFFAWSLGLSVNLGLIAGIDQCMGPVVAKQGAEVGVTRNALNAIRNNLMAVRAILEKLAEINIESALELDAHNAYIHSTEYESIVASLTNTTSLNQAELNRLCELLASHEGRAGMESCVCIPDSSPGAVMGVDPNDMTLMGSSLNACLAKLDTLSPCAAQNLENVRLTHGTGGITEPINVSLARYVGHHKSILSAIIGRVASREGELIAINKLYARRDADVARGLIG